MNYKKILLCIIIPLLLIKLFKNLFLLTEFNTIFSESFSYNLGAFIGKIINVLGVLFLIKICFSWFKTNKSNIN